MFTTFFYSHIGENLFEKSVYKEGQLSLIGTGEQGESLLS